MYHKAGKMDASKFSVRLDPISSGLIQAIESQLFPTQTENAMSIEAEVYKLNVYGEFWSPIIVEHDPPQPRTPLSIGTFFKPVKILPEERIWSDRSFSTTRVVNGQLMRIP